MKMLKSILVAACAFAVFSCGSPVPENGAIITGVASGINPSDTVEAVLFLIDGNSGKGVMTDTLKDGKFQFCIDSVQSDKYYIIQLMKVSGAYPTPLCNGPELYLEPGVKVRVSGEGRYLYNATIKSPVRDQKLRGRFLERMSARDWMDFQDISAHRNAAVYAMFYGSDTTETTRNSLRKVMKEDLDSMHTITGRLTRQSIDILMEEEIGRYALKELQSIAGGVSMGDEENREAAWQIYERLSEEQKASDAGREISSLLEKVSRVREGDTVPEYFYRDASGGRRRLSEMSGKWVLADFWSRGCAPCIQSIPELTRIAEKYSEKLEVVSISVDTEAVWKEASKEHGITWNNWNDPLGESVCLRMFGTPGIPTFVVINPAGTICKIQAGYAESLLDRLLQDLIGD